MLVWDTGVMLERLYQTEISLGSCLKSVMTIQQDLGISHKIDCIGGDWGSGVGSGKVNNYEFKNSPNKNKVLIRYPLFRDIYRV